MELIYLIIGLLVGITIHECSHAFVADRLGDPTPRIQGRLTLNPLAHIDVVGTIMMLLFRFGWGKPVQVNNQYFRSPVRDMALVSLAGPVSNFFVAFVLSLILRSVGDGMPDVIFSLLNFVIDVNIVLGVFNLLPFPPFDGSKVVALFVPRRFEKTYQRFLDHGVVYVILFVVFDAIVLAPMMGHVSLIGRFISFAAAFVKGVIVLGA
ncbi:MAG: site-2 protease family protein [Candidatus Peregrinibacteria bacterium]|nr:site-2 protease family protein [Candidatus Peregrinibacteria bacterium]